MMRRMEGQPCPIPKIVGIVVKRGSESAIETAQSASRFLQDHGCQVILDEGAMGRGADLLLVLGGDGTLLHASRLLGGRPVPILGVNMGSLGFMTEMPQAELYSALSQVLAGEANLSERMKLRVHLHRNGTPGPPELDFEVLNDAVIAKGAISPMTELDVFRAKQFVSRYKADGIIVATPTGSTAYSLAANGPIMHPSTSGVIISPICPHTLTQRPIVVPNDQPIHIMLLNDAEVYLSLDGQTGVPLSRGDRVEVQPSANRVMLVINPDIDFFGILRAKLLWGEREGR